MWSEILAAIGVLTFFCGVMKWISVRANNILRAYILTVVTPIQSTLETLQTAQAELQKAVEALTAEVRDLQGQQALSDINRSHSSDEILARLREQMEAIQRLSNAVRWTDEVTIVKGTPQKR